MRVRGVAAGREPGEARPLPVVSTRLRSPPQERKCPQSQVGGGLSSGELQRALQDYGKPPVFSAQPPEAPAALAEGALRGGGEAARPAARSGGEVPGAEEIPAAPHDMGRRGDQLLL